MNRWMLAAILVAVFCAVLSSRLAALQRATKSSGMNLPQPEVVLLPGAEVSITPARNAILIEGDAADPLKTIELRNAAGKILHPETLAQDQRVILFIDWPPDETLTLATATAHRSITRQIQAPAGAAPLKIDEFELRGRREKTLLAPITFGPRGERRGTPLRLNDTLSAIVWKEALASGAFSELRVAPPADSTHDPLLLWQAGGTDSQGAIKSIDANSAETGSLEVRSLTRQAFMPSARSFCFLDDDKGFLIGTADGQLLCADIAPGGGLGLRWQVCLSQQEKQPPDSFVPVLWTSACGSSLALLTGTTRALDGTDDSGLKHPNAVSLMFLDPKTGAVQSRYPLPRAPVDGFASKDGRWLGIMFKEDTGDGQFDLFDCRPVTRQKPPELVYRAPGGECVISPDGRFIAAVQHTPEDASACKVIIYH
jgi:hypothetical protein